MATTQQQVPALDMGAVEESRELTRKPSFTKKMSNRFKNLVTPRSSRASPTGEAATKPNGFAKESSGGSGLIRVPSIPASTPAADVDAAIEPAVPAPPRPEAADKPAAAAAAPQPASIAEPATPVQEEQEQVAVSEQAPSEAAAPPSEAPALAEPAAVADEKIVAKVEAIQAKAAAAEADAPSSKGNGLFRGIFTIAVVAAAAGAAIALSGAKAAPAKAAPVKPSGKLWRK